MELLEQARYINVFYGTLMEHLGTFGTLLRIKIKLCNIRNGKP